MLDTLEDNYGPTRAVDIQSYVKWREAIAAGPVIPVAVAFSLVSPQIGGEIVFDAKPTSTYIVLHSFNLCNWQEILRVKSQSGPTAVPIRFDNSQGFWRVESFDEQKANWWGGGASVLASRSSGEAQAFAQWGKA